jgi:hypothetical protein
MAEDRLPPEGYAPNPPSKKTLLLLTGGAAAVAALIVLGAVLPAEYNQDPLGIGRMTGLSRLWLPEEVAVSGGGEQPAARRYPAAFRTDVFDIPLAADGDAARRNALEFKVRMKTGDTMVYSWSAEGLDTPDNLFYDFHGHTAAGPGSTAPVSVVDYEKTSGVSANGAIRAPLDGIHGWYLRNRSDRPITVRLKLSGYYDLVPSGEEGNLAGISPQG